MRAPAAIAAGLIGLAAIVLPGAAASAQASETVRVLHVTLDSLHPSEVGPRTPTLLELQSQGTWYEHARAVMAAETLPNHVAMATGTYPGRNGIPGNAGRVAPGDTTGADPDLGDPAYLQADSFVEAVESACPDLRTVTVLSKAYVHRIFADDPVDSRFPQEQFNIPVSDHAPDIATVGFIEQELLTADPPDYLFANLGDIDRAGHIDETGFVSPVPVGRQAAIVQTDTLLRGVVETLKAQGLWDSTVLVISSDHSMDYSNAADAAAHVDVAGALATDPRTQGRFFVSENGGAALVYLRDPAAADADQVLRAAREVLSELDGVLEALYREPNPLEPGADLAAVHPDWHLAGTDRAGEIFVHVEPGHKVSSALPNPSNPLPGNHGHAVTRHVTALVTGGWEGLAAPQSIEASDPDAVDTVTYDDTAALPEQAEQVDFAPTFGWLLGVPDPRAADGGQWQGRVLEEAFARRPEPSCTGAAAPAPTPTATAPNTASIDDLAAAPMTRVTPVTGGGAAPAAIAVLGASVVVAGRFRRR